MIDSSAQYAPEQRGNGTEQRSRCSGSRNEPAKCPGSDMCQQAAGAVPGWSYRSFVRAVSCGNRAKKADVTFKPNTTNTCQRHLDL